MARLQHPAGSARGPTQRARPPQRLPRAHSSTSTIRAAGRQQKHEPAWLPATPQPGRRFRPALGPLALPIGPRPAPSGRPADAPKADERSAASTLHHWPNRRDRPNRRSSLGLPTPHPHPQRRHPSRFPARPLSHPHGPRKPTNASRYLSEHGQAATATCRQGAGRECLSREHPLDRPDRFRATAELPNRAKSSHRIFTVSAAQRRDRPFGDFGPTNRRHTACPLQWKIGCWHALAQKAGRTHELAHLPGENDPPESPAASRQSGEATSTAG